MSVYVPYRQYVKRSARYEHGSVLILKNLIESKHSVLKSSSGLRKRLHYAVPGNAEQDLVIGRGINNSVKNDKKIGLAAFVKPALIVGKDYFIRFSVFILLAKLRSYRSLIIAAENLDVGCNSLPLERKGINTLLEKLLPGDVCLTNMNEKMALSKNDSQRTVEIRIKILDESITLVNDTVYVDFEVFDTRNGFTKSCKMIFKKERNAAFYP